MSFVGRGLPKSTVNEIRILEDQVKNLDPTGAASTFEFLAGVEARLSQMEDSLENLWEVVVKEIEMRDGSE